MASHLLPRSVHQSSLLTLIVRCADHLLPLSPYTRSHALIPHAPLFRISLSLPLFVLPSPPLSSFPLIRPPSFPLSPSSSSPLPISGVAAFGSQPLLLLLAALSIPHSMAGSGLPRLQVSLVDARRHFGIQEWRYINSGCGRR